MSQSSTYFIIAAVVFIVISVPLLVAVTKKSVPKRYTEKVVFVGFDGLGTANLALQVTPNFDFLKAHGKYTEATIDPNSKSSGPNWVGMLTGHNSETSGSGSQNECAEPLVPTLFDEFDSAVYTQWSIILCYSHNIHRFAQDKCSSNFLFNEKKLNDTLLGNESFAFVHIDALDCASHGHGASSNQYRRTLEDIDSTLLPLIVRYVDSHNATLIISADHGSNLKSTGHSWDTVPLILYGKGVEAIDLPVTAESHEVYDHVHFLLGR